MRYDPRDAARAERRPTDAQPRRTVREAGRRSGHRREVSRRKEPPRSFQDRMDGALADVGIHRAVAYRDLADAHFGGHPYAARRGVDKLKRAGLIEERSAKGPQGGSFTVLTATARGAEVARKLAKRRGYAPGQRTWSGLGRKLDLVHDLAIYRAVRDAQDRIAARKGVVSRIRLDAELRRAVARRAERVRVTHGRAAADRERWRAAKELGLPVREDGRVLYPDAQVEYRTEGDRDPGRVNIEIATEHYREGAVAEKARAGFAVYAANGSARSAVAAGLRKAGRDGTGAGAARRDDPASVEL